MRRKRNKKKSFIFKGTLIIFTAAAAAGFTGYGYKLQKNYDAVINKGVYVESVYLGDKKLSEAEAILQKQFGQDIIGKKIEVTANNKTYTLDYKDIQAKYNVSEIVKEAFDYGKNANLLKKLRLVNSEERKDFNLELTYNVAPIDELINRIEIENKSEPSNATLTVLNGTIKITNSIEGKKLQKEKLKDTIISLIKEEAFDKVSKITAPFEVVKAEVTTESLSTINSIVSSFSTNFSTSIENRINNIILATKAINGTLLMPGQVFSFNETVGERTRARGYKEAGVIVGDQIESGLGGGICQVSSTLYNAVLGSSLKATERRNHSLPLSYVPKGLDATVDWGHIDFKFENTLDTPVYIEGYVKNKNVYFNIYANQELKKRTYKMETSISDTIEPNTKYIDDPTLNEGETKVVKKPSTGYKIKVYRKTFENSKLINTELISSDTYRVVHGEIIRGTKKAAPVEVKPAPAPTANAVPSGNTGNSSETQTSSN
jgi:vancomycin resistance protein YoaR